MEPVITVTTQPITDPQAPTPTHYDEVAAQLMAALDAFIAIVPKLEESQLADAKQARRNLNVPDAFCYTAIAATEQLPELESAKKLYAEQNRNRLQYIAAFGPLRDKLNAVSLKMTHGLRANKSVVASDSLEIYRIARAQVANSHNPALAAHVAALKRDLARKLPTKAARDERKAAKLQQVVEEEISKRRIQDVLAQREKEVTAA